MTITYGPQLSTLFPFFYLKVNVRLEGPENGIQTGGNDLILSSLCRSIRIFSHIVGINFNFFSHCQPMFEQMAQF